MTEAPVLMRCTVVATMSQVGWLQMIDRAYRHLEQHACRFSLMPPGEACLLHVQKEEPALRLVCVPQTRLGSSPSQAHMRVQVPQPEPHSADMAAGVGCSVCPPSVSCLPPGPCHSPARGGPHARPRLQAAGSRRALQLHPSGTTLFMFVCLCL